MALDLTHAEDWQEPLATLRLLRTAKHCASLVPDLAPDEPAGKIDGSPRDEERALGRRMRMHAALTRAATRLRIAEEVLAEFGFVERWRAFGDPVIVGAIAYGLVVAPDIDMEVYCDELRIEDGFDVLKACALHPGVTRARFANELAGPDQGLYWQLRCGHDGDEEWKIDMWSLRRDYPGPRGADLVEPMKRALTEQARVTILTLKEKLLAEPEVRCPSIHLYRAVLDDGVDSIAGLRKWLEGEPVDELTDWRPEGGA